MQQLADFFQVIAQKKPPAAVAAGGFFICNRWGSERVRWIRTGRRVAVLFGLFQGATAKNKSEEQETSENNHRINIFLVRKLRSEP